MFQKPKDKMIFALSSLSVILASLSLVSAAPHEHGLVKKSHHGSAAHLHQKRFSGRATWYDVGLGACGDYNGPSDYIVALNSNQLDTSVYPPVQCGRKVRISYQGKSAVATIKDECPGCPFGALDMSKGLFQHFTDLGTGEFTMNWDYVGSGDDSGDDNNKDDNKDDEKKTTTTTHRKTTTTTTTRKTTTTTTTTTKKSSSSSSSSTTSSSSSSSTSSSASSSTTPGSDDTTQANDTVSNIGNQQYFIANLGSLASFGRSS
ncbi:hypothetical protein FRC05_008115 [Tulasnella sp. 425]|nr:hypothetical protein FRC05_008115 [Tulasnella sp. 425]